MVDDDPDAREVLRMILEDAGARVTTSAIGARNARDSERNAPRPTDRRHRDARRRWLLADPVHPESSDCHPDFPAIALTAHTRPEDVEHALSSGFQMHMAKPIDSTRLVDSIASLFERLN